MNEIEAKARQLAQVKTAPAGSYDVCKEAIALEMADWMIQRFYKHLVERCFFTEEEAKEVCKAMEE